MRTTKEIAEHYRSIREGDFLGSAADVLFPYLSFEEAREWLKPEATEEDWDKAKEVSGVKGLSDEAVLADMKDYMDFAWGKVENHRGISASRSIEKMTAWLWLLDDADVWLTSNYPQYGAPLLRAICEKYGFDMPSGEWWFKNMTAGHPCCDGCRSG